VALIVGRTLEGRTVALAINDERNDQSGPFWMEWVENVEQSRFAARKTEGQEKTMDRFPREIHENLGWYVYRLIDPRTGHTFYVGKGRGDRVFEHVKGALKEDETEEEALTDLKTEIIRDIQRQGEQVLHVIHRHGIETQEQAYLVEAALMDAYPGITNLAGGHASADYGCRTAQQIVDAYRAEELSPKESLILIYVGRALEEGRSVYDAVRAAWRMRLEKAQNYKLVLAYDINGLVVGAFRPTAWLPATKENFPFLQTGEPKRIGFEGTRAIDVEDHYLKKKASPRRKGSMIPFRYLEAVKELRQR
jgi:hypothetical protein